MAKLSITLLLQSLRLTRFIKSKIVLNFPDSFRIEEIFLTGPSPTPFIAPRPNLISPFSFTANLYQLSLTSGPSTFNPILLHSFMKKVTDFISFILLLSTEAIYSAG